MRDVQLNKDLGFLRIGAAVPELRVADVDFNVGAIVEVMGKARDEGVQVLTFPEMARIQTASVNTVQGRCRYGLQKLRSLLNSEELE